MKSMVEARGSQVLAAMEWKHVMAKALWFGASRWKLRMSSRSFSGVVLEAGFKEEAKAIEFGKAWAEWVGMAIAVRRYKGVWAASVPVKASKCNKEPREKMPKAKWVH